MILSMPALAQNTQSQNPNSVPSFFYTTLASSKAYAPAQIDTSSSFGLAATHLLGLEFVSNDTVSVAIYIDYKPWGGATWTNLYGDTTTVADSVLTVHEITVRAPTVNRCTYLSGVLRTRTKFLTASAAQYGTYTERWIWKP